MQPNKKHECSIGKQFKSTLLSISIDRVAFETDYDFFVVQCRNGEDKTPMISDPGDAEEFSDGRICGTFAEWKKRYVMLRKNPDNLSLFRRYLDSRGDDFICNPESAKTMDERVLLNLLLNSSVHELDDYIVYNNVNGEKYIIYPKWVRKDHLTALAVSIDRHAMGHVLSLSAVTFSKISTYRGESEKEKAYRKPMYTISAEGRLRRNFKPSDSNYVRGNSKFKNAAVPYFDPTTIEDLKLSKNYIIDLVICDLNVAFGDRLKIEKESLAIEDCLQPVGIDVGAFNDKLRAKIRDNEFVLVNTIPENDDAIKLEKIVTETMMVEFGKEIMRSDEPLTGKFNIRIVHDKEFYSESGLKDEYRKFPGYVVQHLTVEKCITERRADSIDSIVSVLIKELFIKDCVSAREDLVGNWRDRGFKGDVTFLKREEIRKRSRLYRIFRLVMHPDGKFDIDYMDDNDPLLMDVIGNGWDRNNCVSDVEHIIMYGDSICSIEKSGIVPVIDNDIVIDGIRNKKNGRGHGNDGLGTRGYVTYNKALFAITDIMMLSYEGHVLYMCGYDGRNLASKYVKAPNIRLVRCIRGENFLSEIIGLMNVPFVRYGQTTVYPYPYKFMTEYIEDVKKG